MASIEFFYIPALLYPELQRLNLHQSFLIFTPLALAILFIMSVIETLVYHSSSSLELQILIYKQFRFSSVHHRSRLLLPNFFVSVTKFMN